MKFVEHKAKWFGLSGVLVVASIVLLFVFGLNFGIDFVGGSLIEVTYTGTRPEVTEIRAALSEAGFADDAVQPVDEHDLIVRQTTLDEEGHQRLLETLASTGEIEEQRFDSIGPVIGQELKRKSVFALILIFVAIVIYVAWAFRGVSQYVPSWKYGVLTIVAALHDVLITLGVFALLGHVTGATVGTAFVAAILTILGYSVNDSIVVFDRTRENLLRGNNSLAETVNDSINQTFARSINTTITTLLALLAIFFFGGETVRDFVLALIIGIAVGAYSSVFLASPLLVAWEGRKNN